MQSKCINCNKGAVAGHMVSHAKNRLKRLFKPNLQKYVVLEKGYKKSVTLCTKCIKRLKKDGHLGVYRRFVFDMKKKAVDLKKEVEKVQKAVEKSVSEKKMEEKLSKIKIEDIVGKK